VTPFPSDFLPRNRRFHHVETNMPFVLISTAQRECVTFRWKPVFLRPTPVFFCVVERCAALLVSQVALLPVLLEAAGSEVAPETTFTFPTAPESLELATPFPGAHRSTLLHAYRPSHLVRIFFGFFV